MLTTPEEWQGFLQRHAEVTHAAEWPGNPGASEEAIAKIETKLKIPLPPSYRTFLKASNGWRYASRAVPELRPVEQVRWFGREHRDWVEAYRHGEPMSLTEEDYFDYAQRNPVQFDTSHLRHTLAISEVGDSAVILLNPMVIWPDGEWEAWLFANWLPGASRYHSFADWMRYEQTRLLYGDFEHTKMVGELPTVYLDGPTKPNRRIRPREKLYALEELLREFQSSKPKNRQKAAQRLAKHKSLEAVRSLMSALANDPDGDVRYEAAKSLGKIGNPIAIDALIKSIDDRAVGSAAVWALAEFNEEKSAQVLLKIVEEDGYSSGCATGALAKRNDPRAIPILLRFLKGEPGHEHTGEISGRYIAEFQENGFSALEPLLCDADKTVRGRAQVGMSDLVFLGRNSALKTRARTALEKAREMESDWAQRQYLDAWLGLNG